MNSPTYAPDNSFSPSLTTREPISKRGTEQMKNQGHTPHNYNIYFPRQKTCGVWFIVIFKNYATIPMSNAERPQIPPNSFLVPLPFCNIYSVDGNIFGGKVPFPFPLSLRAATPIARISSSSVVSPCSSELSGCLARGTTEPSLRKNT